MQLGDLNNKEFLLVGYDCNNDEYAIVLLKNGRLLQISFSEDQDDGYRSYLNPPIIERLEEVDGRIHLINREVKVLTNNGGEHSEDDSFQVYDLETNQLLFEAYTDHSDTYYPYAIMRFTPIIEKKSRKK